MRQYTVDHIIEKIERLSCLSAKVYEGRRPELPTNVPYFESWIVESPADLCKEVRAFQKRYEKGKYTFFVSTSPNAARNASWIAMYCEIAQEEKLPSLGNLSGNNLLLNYLIQRNERLEERLEEMKEKDVEPVGHFDRVVGIIDRLIMKVGPNTGQPSGQPENSLNNLPPDQQALATAFMQLEQSLGSDVVVRLANRLQTPEGQSKIEMVKQFAYGQV